MSHKVLLVDDDRNVLASFQRHLRNRFQIETAVSGKEGLEIVVQNGPYPVIVSDLRMPGMDGIEFLSRIREIAPDTVRMMLTGQPDLQAAINAVNEGSIFRFLTKPCPIHLLVKAIAAGIEQYRLITSERELLEKTLRGSIKVLTEVLELVNPRAFGRSSRIKRCVRDIACHMHLPDIWRLETAAMLSQIGCIILPQRTVKKLYQGQEFTKEESQFFKRHPLVGADLLGHIPRMKEVAEIIAYQQKHFDGSGTPGDSRKGKTIPLGARVLKVVLDFDMLEATGIGEVEALVQLKDRSGWYDPDVLSALEAVVETQASYEVRYVPVFELKENMILDQDIRTIKGGLVILKGHEVNSPLIKRLKNFASTVGVKEPIRVIERKTGEEK
jgi:response regulator RpfG family c-di-GMP phosphodiesterase